MKKGFFGVPRLFTPVKNKLEQGEPPRSRDRIDLMPEWFQKERERTESFIRRHEGEVEYYNLYHGFRSHRTPKDIEISGITRPFVTWNEFYDHVKNAAIFFAANTPIIYDKYMNFLMSHFMMWYNDKATIWVTTSPGGSIMTPTAIEAAKKGNGTILACDWASRYPEAIWNGFAGISRDLGMEVSDEKMHEYLNYKYGKPMWIELNLLWPDAEYNLNTGLTYLPPELVRRAGRC